LKDALYSNYTFSLTVQLNKELWSFNRQVYTILDMIANIGGLSDGLIFLIGWMATLYNARAFE
jgi:hypothetical protein